MQPRYPAMAVNKIYHPRLYQRTVLKSLNLRYFATPADENPIKNDLFLLIIFV